jgi:predicted lysophospholipase L1 biosynthesis ABC-type transport system permease subunit
LATSNAVLHVVGAARRRTLTNLICEQLSVGFIAALAGAILLLLIGTQILDWWWPLVLFIAGAD